MMNRKKFFTFFIQFFFDIQGKKRRAVEGARTYMKEYLRSYFSGCEIFLRMEIFLKFLLLKPLTGNEKRDSIKKFIYFNGV